MSGWRDVVFDITSIEGDLDGLLAVPLPVLSRAPDTPEELGADLERVATTLGLSTLLELLEDARVPTTLQRELDRFERRSFCDELPDAVRRFAKRFPIVAGRPAPWEVVAHEAESTGSGAAAPTAPVEPMGEAAGDDTRAFDARKVPRNSAELEPWARHFGIDLRHLYVPVRIGQSRHSATFRAVELVDDDRFPRLASHLDADREALRRAGETALRDRALAAEPLLARRVAFLRRRAEPQHPAVRAHVEALRAALAELPAPPAGLEGAPIFRYPDRRVRFQPKGPALGIESDEDGTPIAVDLDAARATLWGGGASAPADIERAALGCAIDALCDPEGHARRELETWAATPRWQRALGELEERLQTPRRRREGAGVDRLAFRVTAGELGLPRVVLQTAKASGGFSPGRLTKITEARRSTSPDVLEAEILDLCDALGGPGIPAHERPLFGRLMDLLGRHPRVFVDGDPQRPVRVQRGHPRLVASPHGGGYRLELWLGDDRIQATLARGQRTLGIVPPRTDRYLWAVLDEVSTAVLESLPAALGPIPVAGVDALFRTMRAVGEGLDLELPPELRGDELTPDPRTVVRLALRAGATLDASLRVRPWPEASLLIPGQGPATVHGVRADGERIYATRDRKAERERAHVIAARLLPGVEPPSDFILAVEDPDLACEAILTLAELAEDVDVEWEGPSLVVGSTATTGSLRLRVEGRHDWFGIEGGVDADGEHVSLAALLEATRAGRRFVRLKGGKLLALGRELRDRLARADDLLVREHGKLMMGPQGADALAELVDDAAQIEATADWVALRERWKAARAYEPVVPPGMVAELRPYQTAGFGWLARLAACGVAGCLADDMGLGKTVQALTLLVARAHEGPALVVAPTSVGPNWEAEAARFAPGLRCTSYRGAGRSDRLSDLGAGDVIVTSYDLLVRDADTLAAIPFGTVVFDEAHAMKNPASKRAGAARRLDAGFRLALTGTPVENHLGELWSLFRVLMPSLFGSWERFRDRFAGPIERDRDPERQAALSTIVKPYLLRRTKEEVAPELPPRTELVRFVDLSEAERDLYEAERRTSLEALAKRGADGKKAEGEGRFIVFSALLRLRQLACHPRLRHADSQVPSAKLASTLELLDELKDAGHRALVFSQFTSHLAIVAAALRARGFTIVELDGSTPAEARAARVRDFQAGEADAFLISLKAGGVGLNLTAADHVVHLDPWWNPAAEDQASDRAHRIGQTKPVTVVRMIARGTIEETVLALHEGKRELADAVLSGGDVGAGLSTSDLVALMERSDEGPATARETYERDLGPSELTTADA